MSDTTFDYIIVGGGTAGCVLAARLSENPRLKILLVEAGPRYRGLPIQIPASIGDLYREGRYHWDYTAAPEPHCGDRELPYKLGRILGGSSAINGQVWVRGNPADYNEWAADGCPGWEWENVEPLFRRIENYHDDSDPHMGQAGPIGVTQGSTTAHELNNAFLQAAAQAGFPINQNHNGPSQDGFCEMHRNTQFGRRSDVYEGYLKPALKRDNLTIVTKACVRTLRIQDRRVVGIDYSDQRGSTRCHTTREVLLCAGALASPQLLMLSGIGSRETLTALGIDVVHDLPGVGQGLQTHPTVKLTFTCRKPISLLRWTRSPGKWLAGLEWIFRRRGPATSNHFEMGGFMRSDPLLDRPDLQFTFVPLSLGELYGASDQHGFELYVVLVGCKSRGWSRITSTDPDVPPAFRFNFLKDQRDVSAILTGCEMARKIVAQNAFDDLTGTELQPGAGVAITADWIRNTASVTHHLTSTCRMGSSSNPNAVVGADLTVHGLEGIRVVDASVIPRVTTGNTHAAVVMLGERASELIAEAHSSDG